MTRDLIDECFWCRTNCGGTCLKLRGSTQIKPNDPAGWMLDDSFTSTPNPSVYRDHCYICRDPEFAQMGLPLCRPCYSCGAGHIPADDDICSDCGVSEEDQRWNEGNRLMSNS